MKKFEDFPGDCKIFFQRYRQKEKYPVESKSIIENGLGGLSAT